jgi:hypothetical protein
MLLPALKIIFFVTKVSNRNNFFVTKVLKLINEVIFFYNYFIAIGAIAETVAKI